jgi:hypothetical protein
MTDTDPKIKAFTESTERRIDDLYKQNKEDFDELKGLVKVASADIANTRLEMVAIKTEMVHLVRKTDLVERVAEIKDHYTEEIKAHMREHMMAKHKSLPPSDNSRGWGPKQIAALVGAIVALSGALAVVAQAVIR